MKEDLYKEFLKSGDALRVYATAKLVFSSTKERFWGLLDYIDGPAASYKGVVIMDKVMGNAAALLAVKAGTSEVWSPLGSQLAQMTLQKYGVEYHIDKMVPFILHDNGKDMCPSEILSIDRDPEEFYSKLKSMRWVGRLSTPDLPP